MSKETNKTEQSDMNTEKKGKVLQGVVVGDKMQETAIVAVSRFVKHPKYRKFIKRMKKFHVHNPQNEKKVGDKVTIRECKPISKTKRFEIIETK